MKHPFQVALSLEDLQVFHMSYRLLLVVFPWDRLLIIVPRFQLLALSMHGQFPTMSWTEKIPLKNEDMYSPHMPDAYICPAGFPGYEG